MTITWYGYSCFKIEERTKDAEVAVVTDPFAADEGNKPPRSLAADIVTVSHDHNRHNNVAAVQGTPFLIKGPGEYEVKDLFVTGISTYHDLVEGKEKGRNTMYYITVGDLHLVHLGDLKHPLEDRHLEDFHNIDVLCIPVGGGSVLNAKQAAEIVDQLEPRVIIPMHYKVGGFCQDSETVDAFLKAIGAPKSEVMAKWKVLKKDLPQEERQVILLDPQ